MRRLRSTDGVQLAAYDLGGHGPDLLFIHATGFCAQVFDRLATSLAPAYHCWAVDLRGHGRTTTPGSVGFGWSGFADDVLAAVDGLSLDRPVAFGHSSGGAAVLLAAADRPDGFASLWCYEPIVWPEPERARRRAEGLAEGARHRRDRFASRQEAYANFASKPPLSGLAPDVLRAYVEHGFEDEPDGTVTLRCRPEVEAAIYLAAIDGDRFARLADVTCPVVVGAGERSDAVTPERAGPIVHAVRRGRLAPFPGLGHFGPLEDPEAVAEAVLRR
jgi:pimeloyl-ACP methyl ester carboxylesterase